MPVTLPVRPPDAQRSIESYRRLAQHYDASCTPVMPIRGETVSLLNVQSGDVVVDVASGTGLSFPLIMKAIGPEGRLIAVEHSPEMMALARQRVAAAGWANVTLVEAPAERADIRVAVDALLFHYTHDVLQSPTALAQLFACAKPGARVAVAGAKFTSWWLAPLNVWVMIRARRYLTTFTVLHRPWRHLLTYVPELTVRRHLFDTGYIAYGRYRPPRPPNRAATSADASGVDLWQRERTSDYGPRTGPYDPDSFRSRRSPAARRI